MKAVLIIVFTLLAATLQAQTRVMKGRIVDRASQAGIAYTNIGIEGTYFGTASDANGFFELKIPDDFAGKSLYVSAVGYENRRFRIEELLQSDFARIALSEQTYNIAGIDVAARSRVLFRIIRTASEQVPDNYFGGPVGLTFHFLGKTLVNDSATQVREAIVKLTDQTGYSQPSVEDAFRGRNYRYAEVNKNFRPIGFADGQTGFDELIDLDIARARNTIFNPNLINDYDLHLEGISPWEGDSVWVISYHSAKPDLAHSGDYYASRIDGKLYILKSNYALVRHECEVEAGKNNPQNRSLYTTGNEQQSVRYHLTTLYQRYGDRYLVSFFDLEKQFVDPEGQRVTWSRKASLLDVTQTPEPIQGRTYFEDSTFDEKFWNSFHSGAKL